MSFTFTITRDNTAQITNPLTVNLTVGGTATFGTDYTVSGADSFTTTTASVIIPSGATLATIIATQIPDAIVEPDETIILTIVPTSGVSIAGTNSVATATILNDDNSTANLVFVTNGDANGLVYYLGTNSLTTAFINPLSRGNLIAVVSSTASASDYTVVADRLAGLWHTADISNSWIAFDLASKSLAVNKYTVRHRNDIAGNALRNWVLEGANTVASFNIAGINAATWTPIDTRSNDTTLTAANQYYTLTCNGSSASYLYLRFRAIGIESSGSNYLVLGEIEFYGILTP